MRIGRRHRSLDAQPRIVTAQGSPARVGKPAADIAPERLMYTPETWDSQSDPQGLPAHVIVWMEIQGVLQLYCFASRSPAHLVEHVPYCFREVRGDLGAALHMSSISVPVVMISSSTEGDCVRVGSLGDMWETPRWIAHALLGTPSRIRELLREAL